MKGGSVGGLKLLGSFASSTASRVIWSSRAWFCCSFLFCTLLLETAQETKPLVLDAVVVPLSHDLAHLSIAVNECIHFHVLEQC